MRAILAALAFGVVTTPLFASFAPARADEASAQAEQTSGSVAVAPEPVAEAPTRIVPPDDKATFSFILDNDLFGGTDKYYTNGFLFSYRSPSDLPPGALDDFADVLNPLVSENSSRRWGVAFGQDIFTPEDILLTNPDPEDRPYAGWLYGALSLSSYTDTSYGSLELQAGVVGPSALGEQVQNNVHDFWSINRAFGWDYQLKDEPGINLVASRLWRVNYPFDATKPRGLAWGIVPNLQGSLGNVQTYASGGAMVRIGSDLYADFGPPRTRPSVAGSGFVQPDPDNFGWYVFVGVEGRAVGRDIFLEGNTFKDSRSVDKKIFVGDASIGAAMLFSWGRLAYVHTVRSEEFQNQAGPFEFGSLSLSVRF